MVRLVRDEHDPNRARAFDGALRYEAGTSLRTALLFADPRGLEATERALRNLAEKRTSVS